MPTPPSSTSPPSTKPHHNDSGPIAGGAVAGVALLGLGCFLERRRRRRQHALQLGLHDNGKVASSTAPLLPRHTTDTNSALATQTAPAREAAVARGAPASNDDAMRTMVFGEIDENLTSTSETSFTFTASVIADATNSFGAANKLAEGAFGAVYRGRLPQGRGSGPYGGREAAIKVLRLDRAARDAERDADGEGEHKYSGVATFEREADLLARYRHPNIVSYWGRGAAVLPSHTAELPCLVCEFMPGQSLDKRLAPTGVALTWRERHGIASDVARGLAFLHSAAGGGDPVVHQDVKPANILLGPSADGGKSGLVAKLADFGISRVIGKEGLEVAQSYVKTKQAAGTPLYMPTEYHRSGKVSAKTDTYAFGIVLLELLTGRPPRNPDTAEPLDSALYHVLQNPSRSMQDVADHRAGDWKPKSWCKLAIIARRCSEAEYHRRCAVAEVVAEIDELADRGTRRRGLFGLGGRR